MTHSRLTMTPQQMYGVTIGGPRRIQRCRVSLVMSVALLLIALTLFPSPVTAQWIPPADVEVPDVVIESPPHSDIPLEKQTCDQLEDTFDYAVWRRMGVDISYQAQNCRQILEDPDASLAAKRRCEGLADEWVYWSNYGATVRSVALLKQCPWAY